MFGYRSDIDGMRALAILGVILFHLNESWLPGGFLGVDIFFVISGFVITNVIVGKHMEGGFGFSDFYWRRIKRILPAYVGMITAVMVAAYFLLIPTDFERLGGAAIYALSFVSNFFFWNESGYFDVEAMSKPLLHTWSLAVEGQFYLFYPLALIYGVLKLPLKLRPCGMLILIISFCILSEWFVGQDQVGGFFLTPFRFFEFLIGGIFVFVPVIFRQHRWLHNLLVFVGIGAILSAFILYSKEMRLPGINTLLPLLGACCMIYSGNHASISRWYNNALGIEIGKMSYSLYLYHWPVIVFIGYMGIEGARLWGMAIPVFLVLAFISYRCIENPFRSRTSKQMGGGVILGVLMIGLLFASAHIWREKGWKWRFGVQLESYEYDKHALREENIMYDIDLNNWYYNPDKLKVVVIGDSHSRHIANGIRLNNQEIQVKRLHIDDTCFSVVLDPQKTDLKCAEAKKEFGRWSNFKKAGVVFFSMGWGPINQDEIQKIIKQVREKTQNPDVTLVIMTRGPQFIKMHSRLFHAIGNNETIQEINRIAFEVKSVKKSINKELGVSALENKIKIINTEDLICSEGACDFLGAEGELHFYDQGHWTLAGAKVFGARLMERYPELFIKDQPSDKGTPKKR